jgi:hypothetical protein
MEYLVVRFLRPRRVRIDAKFNGRTGELIELEPGTHVVSLGPPHHNYAPEQFTITLQDTSELSPHEINFEPKA